MPTDKPQTGGRQNQTATPADTLLIISGSENDRNFLGHSLEEAGYQLLMAVDGDQGLEMLKTHKPAVVLLDLHAPGLAAEQLVAQISSDDALRIIPVIILAGRDDNERIEACLGQGADDYLVRPYSPTLLKAQVREFQEIRQRRLEEREASKQRLRDKIEHDVEIAREIQLNFLPRELPQPEGWDVAAYFAPAREVAGDFYDAFPMAQGRRVGFVIADVCDKGVGAALFMALARSLTRAFASQNYSTNLMDGLGPEFGGRPTGESSTETRRRRLPSIGSMALQNAVVLTNAYITTNHLELNYFATLFFGMVDPLTGSMSYINGGHCPPIILGADGKVKTTLKATGTPVGMMPDAVYTIGEAQLEPGDILFGYSDGVTDARNPAGKMYTEKRMLELLQGKPPESAQEVLMRFKHALNEHISTADQYDDITMIAVRRLV
jgi:serine phosphatase RsbU (regulator of sigma subunit)